MEADRNTPRALVLHRHELRDVCEALERLGVDAEQRSTVERPGPDAGPWQLVVSTPQRLLELHATSPMAPSTTLIAVCDGFSRTLSARLTQAGVDFVLRRPVHPAALRLLLLHALYRGPEKRRARRVSVGAPVRVRLGWRSRPGMLLELSTGGCRVQMDGPVAAEARIGLRLPRELTGKRPLRLRGRVIRADRSTRGDAEAGHEIAVVFDVLSEPAYQTLAELVQRHDRGPAEWKGAPPRELAPAEPGEDAAVPARQRDPEAPERRRSRRLRYAKPVLVKREGASRVLMGRDLSSGGMRVVRDPNLRLGDQLKLAIYGQDGIPPLMLQATVAREDGPFLVLLFENPGDAALEQLNRVMTSLPLSGHGEGGRPTPLVVSEVVETQG